MGVLSALPIIAVGNVCCCLWVISGGVVAAYALQQGQPQPITPADGAFVGFLSGVLGAFVYIVIYVPTDVAIGPFEREMLRRALENMGGAEGFRSYFERSEVVPGAFRYVLSFLTMLFVGAIFSTIGGLLGALMFRKREVPRAPDTPGNFNSPIT
jgi:uncharacterized membrane protein YeaQ/YmgE (transglycosylase-associated protein family)